MYIQTKTLLKETPLSSETDFNEKVCSDQNKYLPQTSSIDTTTLQETPIGITLTFPKN